MSDKPRAMERRWRFMDGADFERKQTLCNNALLRLDCVSMKRILLALVLTASSMAAGSAGEASDFFSRPGKLIEQPDFKAMPGAPWQMAKGKWDAADGVVTPTPIKEENH